MGDPDVCFRCGKSGHWSKECPRLIWSERGGTSSFRDRFPPPPPPFLADRIMDRFRQDFDYYDRRYDEARDMFDRRGYPSMGGMRGRDFPGPPPGRREPMPPIPPLMARGGSSGGSMRSGGGGGGYDQMFTRRSPPRSRFGVYEDFSRDSFDDRRPGMRGTTSPTHRYAPY